MGLFDRAPVVNPEAGPDVPKTPPEKTQAELIAEAIGAALKPVLDGQAKSDARFEEFTTSLKRPAKTEAEASPSGPPSVFDDENQAFAARVGPLYMRQLETEARLARGEVKREYEKKGFENAWEALEVEIDKTLEGSPVVDGQGKAVRGDKVYIRNVVDMIFGREAMKNGLKFGGRDRGFFTETAGGSESNLSPEAVADGLTGDQRKVFGRMGVKVDDAKKSLARLKFIN